MDKCNVRVAAAAVALAAVGGVDGDSNVLFEVISTVPRVRRPVMLLTVNMVKCSALRRCTVCEVCW